MDRRSFLRAGLGASAGVLLASCGTLGSPESKGTAASKDAGRTLRLPGGEIFSAFPSPYAYTPPVYSFVINIYDTLLWENSSERLVPWLASDHERSPDGRSYTFKLREDVRWHDGRPFTAEDVKFSFDYFRANESMLPFFIIFRPDNVEAVTSLGKYEVEIRLDKPAITFPQGVASRFPIVPQHIWSSIPNPAQARGDNLLVGTGPYRLKSRSAALGSMLFVANDDYFLRKPMIGRLEFVPAEDQLNALLAGDIDAGTPGLGGVNPGALAPFRRNPAFGTIQSRPDFLISLYWNLARGGPLADPVFRRACAKAMDRADMVKRLFGGLGVPGNPGFLPPGHPYHADVEQYEFNLEQANRELDQAGYKRAGPNQPRMAPDGKPLVFKLLAVIDIAPTVELVRQALKRIGVEFQVDPADFLAAFEAMSLGNYDMAVILYGGVGGDPDYMRNLYSSRLARKPFHHAGKGYKDAEMDELADRQLVTFDEQERKRMVARMQQIAARDIPFLHLYYLKGFLIYRKAAFSGWNATKRTNDLLNKQSLVTGSAN